MGQTERALEQYGNMLYRIALTALGNSADAEDVVQETLIKHFEKAPVFTDDEHERAWLIRVAVNRCKVSECNGGDNSFCKLFQWGDKGHSGIQ